MRVITRQLAKEILFSSGFVLIALVALFAFFDLVGQLAQSGVLGQQQGHAGKIRGSHALPGSQIQGLRLRDRGQRIAGSFAVVQPIHGQPIRHKPLCGCV